MSIFDAEKMILVSSQSSVPTPDAPAMDSPAFEASAGGAILKAPLSILRALRWLAYAALVVYVGWNGIHLIQGQVPGSMFTAACGLPCPTTGGSRAINALLHGQWLSSLQWHPLAVPIAVLFFASVGQVVFGRIVRGRFELPSKYVYAWGGLLGFAWLVQLAHHATGSLGGPWF